MKIDKILAQLTRLSDAALLDESTHEKLQKKCDQLSKYLPTATKKELMHYASDIWKLQKRLSHCKSTSCVVQSCIQTIALLSQKSAPYFGV